MKIFSPPGQCQLIFQVIQWQYSHQLKREWKDTNFEENEWETHKEEMYHVNIPQCSLMQKIWRLFLLFLFDNFFLTGWFWLIDEILTDTTAWMKTEFGWVWWHINHNWLSMPNPIFKCILKILFVNTFCRWLNSSIYKNSIKHESTK